MVENYKQDNQFYHKKDGRYKICRKKSYFIDL
jgi:hypothetical protein